MSVTAKTTLIGILFGLCFPIVAIIGDCLFNDTGISWRAVITNHGQQPLLWIIDMAPFVLGAVFFEIGRRGQMLLNEQAKAFSFRMRLANDFLTIISHELRTPMNGIIGGVQLAQRSEKLEDINGPLSIIADSAYDMMAMVDDILIYAECVSGRMSSEVEEVALPHMLKTLAAEYHTTCQEKSLKLIWTMPEELPNSVYLDANKLAKALCKLLDNAVKFTSKGSITVAISLDTNKKIALNEPLKETVKDTAIETLIVKIKDTGIGIAVERIGDLLSPFQQSDTGLQREYGGLGIGLSLAKSLIDVLNGQIELASELGSGTCVTLRIPLPTIAPAHFKAETINEYTPDHDDYPILIVEDNLVNQMVLKKMIDSLGYNTLVAENGQEALQLLKQHTIALVMMDLQMPVMDGLTCTKSIRASGFRKLPIIALTANIMSADKKSCIAVGMNDYLTKPVKLESLRPVLERYVLPPSKQACCHTQPLKG